MYTKAQLESKIGTDLPDNTTKDIDPEILRGVLVFMLDRQYNQNEIPVDIDGMDATTLEEALEELLAHTSLTASQIRDLLAGLTGTNRLTKLSVRGADFALNRRGAGDIFSGAYTTGMTNILPGDFWIYDAGGAGGTDSINEGDWVVAMRSGLSTPFDFTDTDDWLIVSFGDLSASEIATLLNSITTVADMVQANRISYDGGHVQTALDNFTTALALKQSAIKKDRLQCTNLTPTPTKIFTATLTGIIQLAINRVPYQGIEADDFTGAANGYDFIYSISGTTITITLSPSLGVMFESGMIVDILFY